MSATLTSRERMQRILKRQIPDRIGLDESFWQDTVRSWLPQGYPQATPPWKVFGLDLLKAGGLNPEAYPGRHEILQESAEWRVAKDGNGATMRKWKERPGVPEHLAFEIRDGATWRRGWREAVRTFKPQRLSLEPLIRVKETCAKEGLFCCYSLPEVFELGKNYTGHVNMCMGMVEDPEWIDDMFDSFVEMLIQGYGRIFEQVGLPDGVWISGDIGFKGKPFVSPAMHRERVAPHNKRLIGFFKSQGLPVIFHSCGYIEPLVPGFIETGIDMLQAMEVKAGVDLLRLKPLYGDKIGFMGNVDVRALESNDLERVEQEVRTKVLCGKEGGGYAFHSDHSIPSSVRFETYKFAVQQALKYGRY